LSWYIAASIALVPSIALSQAGATVPDADAEPGAAELVVVTGTRKAGVIPAETLSPYGSEFLVDVEARAQLAENYEIAVGGENIFDQFPDDELDPILQVLGVSRSLTSPFGFNGGYWYARARVRF
jgi:hypothetical protein